MSDARCLRTRLSCLGVFCIGSSRFCCLVLLLQEYCLWIVGMLASLLVLVFLSDFTFLRFVSASAVVFCLLYFVYLLFSVRFSLFVVRVRFLLVDCWACLICLVPVARSLALLFVCPLVCLVCFLVCLRACMLVWFVARLAFFPSIHILMYPH